MAASRKVMLFYLFPDGPAQRPVPRMLSLPAPVISSQRARWSITPLRCSPLGPVAPPHLCHSYSPSPPPPSLPPPAARKSHSARPYQDGTGFIAKTLWHKCATFSLLMFDKNKPGLWNVVLSWAADFGAGVVSCCRVVGPAVNSSLCLADQILRRRSFRRLPPSSIQSFTHCRSGRRADVRFMGQILILPAAGPADKAAALVGRRT